MLKNDSLDLLHDDLAAAHMAPTWKYVSEFVSREPRTSYRPWLWRWDDIIPLLMRAGDLITPERGAERRSMEHVNPDLTPFYSTSHTIATAVQLVRAGERAPAHRHAAGAIRFAAQSQGGTVYTKVQGEKLLMEKNDLLLTPAWSWHEHSNETEHDIVWLDALDFPLVNLMQASLFEPGEGEVCPDKPLDYTRHRMGHYRPTGWSPYPEQQPVMRYPWTEMQAALCKLAGEEGSPFDGILLEYVNPANAGPTLPTMSCRAQLLRGGEHTKAHRATSSTVYYVIEGSGTSVIAGTAFNWRQGDVFVVPTWAWHEHRNGNSDAYLFSITDQPSIELLGMYRERALTANGGRQDVTATF
ncbi:MAG: 5-aminosalicylate 1,2-dioxygenase [Pseudolabrys sp.]